MNEPIDDIDPVWAEDEVEYPGALPSESVVSPASLDHLEITAPFVPAGTILKVGQLVSLVVSAEFSGWRLDQFLAQAFPIYSRVYLRRVIGTGAVQVDARGGKPSYRLKPNQTITFVLPEIPRESPIPEAIPLDILYSDDRIAVINKPPHMVVHPARGHWSGTLASALQHCFGGQLSAMGGPTRPGIVHRLDRDTSGVILVAKDDLAHQHLTQQFADRTTEKEYLAITAGAPYLDRDVVKEPLGPHPRYREQMAIRRDLADALSAETWFEVKERLGTRRVKQGAFALVEVHPKTGRTHQIRVHLAHIGTPILCDRLYGSRAKITQNELLGIYSPDGRHTDDSEVVLQRQALHAHRIRFNHPTTNERMEIVAPLPADMQRVLDILRQESN
ncbi:MAG: RluA family pseudouridine synthase [Thermoguttaceae bacterium]|nr:RluA family pseudouridine synthase [Thermoguttaceae bacterium]